MKLKPIVNRAASGDFVLPSDGYYLVAPCGEWPHTDSGLTQIIDDAATSAMATAFRPGVDELLVDFDHMSENPDERTTAAGWIQGLQARPDGLWAQIRWSKSGSDALTGGEYRYISPVWLRSDVEFLDNNRIRPLRLDSAGLTNKPNLKLPALSNRSEEAPVVKGQTMQPTLTTKHDPAATFDNRVKAIASRDRISYDAAFEKAKREHPDEYAQLLSSSKRENSHSVGHSGLRSQPTANRAGEDATLTDMREASNTFNNRVREMMRSERRSYSNSFERCQLKFPTDYARLSAAYLLFRNRIQTTKAV